VAASGSRTAVNDGAGAKSKLSGVIAALMMIVFLLFFTQVLVSLPLVVLAAIIIVSSLGMIGIGALVRMYRFRWETFAVTIITLLGVVIVGIVPGFLIAVTMSLFLFTAISSRPSDMHLVRDGGSIEFRPIGNGPLARQGIETNETAQH
jgi:SulP family sulfate permease